MTLCPICKSDNEDGVLWCKKCHYQLGFFTSLQKYYEREFLPPKVQRKEPFKIVGLKAMPKMTKDPKTHAEERVRVQFRILHVYAWMLQKQIVLPEELVMWGPAPLQQGKSGGRNETAHQLLASLMVSPDGGKKWHYLYQVPRLANCSSAVKQRVELVVGALHATVSDLDKSYNDTDFVIELEIRAIILRYIDEIRGIHYGKEYRSKTWPALFYSFRDDYVNLCGTLLNEDKRSEIEHEDRKVDLGVLKVYMEVASTLRYEQSSKIKEKFKAIVNLSEGKDHWK